MIGIIIFCFFILTILLYEHFKNIELKNEFKIIPDIYKLSNIPMNVGETYDYPCVGCFNNLNQLKPYSMYNITGNRCIKNDTNTYLENKLAEIAAYNPSVDPGTIKGYASCTGTYNTMYTTSSGRYIKIYNNNNVNLAISLLSIGVYDLSGVLLSTNAEVFGYPIKIINNAVDYPNRIINMNNTQVYTTGNYMINYPNPYILIDLKSTYTIFKIVINHSTIVDSSTLNGATIVLLKDNTIENMTVPVDKYYDEYGPVSYVVLPTDNSLIRNIYSQNKPISDTISNPMIISSIIPWTNDYQCVNVDQTMYNNARYNITNSTGTSCFMTNFNDVTINTVSKLINDTISFNDCKKFKSCNFITAKITDFCIPPHIWFDCSDSSTFYSDQNLKGTIVTSDLGTVRSILSKGVLNNCYINCDKNNFIHYSNTNSNNVNKNSFLRANSMVYTWYPSSILNDFYKTSGSFIFIGKTPSITNVNGFIFSLVANVTNWCIWGGSVWIGFGTDVDNRSRIPSGYNEKIIICAILRNNSSHTFDCYKRTNITSKWEQGVPSNENLTKKTYTAENLATPITLLSTTCTHDTYEFIMYKGYVSDVDLLKKINQLSLKWGFVTNNEVSFT